MKNLRATLSIACLVAIAACGSDDDGASPAVVHGLTPGAANHGTMTPAAPVETSDDTGPVTIVARADEGFTFAGWVATPADMATFADAGLDSTTVVLSGDATIAPTFMVAVADYFVNPRLGSDDAAGTSAAQAFRTITQAIAAINTPAAAGGKAGGPVVALAPGLYDAAGGEVFPLVVPAGTTLVGDEENRGEGITVQGAGPLPSWSALQAGVIPSTNATIAGLHLVGTQGSALAYDAPSGGIGITLRRNTVESAADAGLYIQVADWGAITDNVFLAAPMTLVAVGGSGTTAVRDNVFHGPVELDENALDLGGGAGSSPGNNQFIGDGMSYFSGAGIMARNNHWRNSPPTVAPAYQAGPSTYDMYLAGESTTVDTTGYW